MVKDSLLLNFDENLNILPKCQSCGLPSHLTIQCNFFHFIPDKEKIIKKYEFSSFQERNSGFKRNINSKKDRRLFSREKKVNEACRLQKQMKKERKFFISTQIKKIAGTAIDFDSKLSIQSSEGSQLYLSDNEISDNEDNIETKTKNKSKKEKTFVKNNSFFSKQNSLNKEKSTDKIEEINENSGESIQSLSSLNEINEGTISLTEDSKKNDFKEKKSKTSNLQSSSQISRKSIDASSFAGNFSSTLKSTLKKSTTSSNTILKSYFDYDYHFEKYEFFENYFQNHNIDKVLALYEQKRKKNIFNKKFYERNSLKTTKKKCSKQNKFAKYSFFQDPLALAKNKPQYKDKQQENIEHPKKTGEVSSPFFKKKEFNKKSFSLLQLVERLKKK